MICHSTRWSRLHAAAVALSVALVAAPADAQAPRGGQTQAPALRTVAEASGFTTYTPYDSMMAYLDDVRATSIEMRLGTYGETWSGRELPYVIFSRPGVTQPWEAWSLGKPIVVFAGGVHGGERTLRESLLILIRDFATRGTPANALLDDLVVIVVPQINPDGFSAEPRPTRGNAWGIDLNRDYIKLEQPEIASYVQNVILRWAPHLYVDGHNGGSYPYNINYQCPSHAEPDQRITQMCDREIFPAIDAKLATAGYKSWYYQSGSATRWNVGGSEARIGRNYGGFANTIGILFESPGAQEMSDGVKSGQLAYLAVAEYVQKNAQKVKTLVQTARRETIEMGEAARGEIVVQQRYGPEPRRVTYEIGVGHGSERRAQRVQSDSLMKVPIPTKTRPRPYAYLLPRDARDAVELLRKHDIAVEELQDSITVEVDAYTLAGVSYEQAYNHAAATRVTVGEVVTARRMFPRGTFLIRTGQMQGRVAAHMLEPESTDNIVYWNLMDAWLPKAALARASAAAQGGADEEDDAPRGQRQQGPPIIPIYKVMRPTPMPGRLIGN